MLQHFPFTCTTVSVHTLIHTHTPHIFKSLSPSPIPSLFFLHTLSLLFPGLIFGHAYNSQTLGEDSVHMGKYGALLHMSTEPSNSEVDVAELRLLGDRICQHVIGLNPVGVEKEDEVEEDEVLANQPYLFNNSVTVGELMAEKGVSVTKFVRYALGEKEEGPFSLSS